MTYIYAKRPPRVLDYPLKELFEMTVFQIKGDVLDYDDTSPFEMFDIPANTVVIGIGWRVIDRFADSGVQINPMVKIGDTDGSFVFGQLTWAELCSSARTGFIPINYETTSAMKIDAVYSSGGASTAGSVEFWLMYRPWSGAQTWTNRV